MCIYLCIHVCEYIYIEYLIELVPCKYGLKPYCGRPGWLALKVVKYATYSPVDGDVNLLATH